MCFPHHSSVYRQKRDIRVLIYPNHVLLKSLFCLVTHFTKTSFKVYFGKKLNLFSPIIRTKCVPVRMPGQMHENWNSHGLIRTSGHSRCFTLPTQMLQSVANNVVHRALYWEITFLCFYCNVLYKQLCISVIYDVIC